MTKEAKQAERERLREQHFPQGSWYDRDHRKGFAQPPRALPLIRRLIKDLSKTSAGDLYMALWFNDWGQSVIEVNRVKSLLYQAGANADSKRADANWNRHIGWLAQHGFVVSREHNFEKHGLVMLCDPYKAVLKLAKERPAEPAIMEWLPRFESFCSEWSIDLEAVRLQLEEGTPEPPKPPLVIPVPTVQTGPPSAAAGLNGAANNQREGDPS